jgi:DNA repair protein RecO (recombination protein O)
MAPIATPAVILHAFPYGETSKIVRLLTSELGPQSVMAKGARQPKSKFGAQLQVFSEGSAQIYVRAGRDLQTLADFDVRDQHRGLSARVERYAAAAAVAEIVMRLAPAEAHPGVYEVTSAAFTNLEMVDPALLDVASLVWLWAVVGALGFAPRADACARDGRPLPGGRVRFSVIDGGFLCTACGRGSDGTALEPQDRAVLEALIGGDVGSVGALTAKHAAAHRRLLRRFVERHVAEGRELRALEMWQELG